LLVAVTAAVVEAEMVGVVATEAVTAAAMATVMAAVARAVTAMAMAAAVTATDRATGTAMVMVLAPVRTLMIMDTVALQKAPDAVPAAVKIGNKTAEFQNQD
jgi:hypothetical protein